MTILSMLTKWFKENILTKLREQTNDRNDNQLR